MAQQQTKPPLQETVPLVPPPPPGGGGGGKKKKKKKKKIFLPNRQLTMRWPTMLRRFLNAKLDELIQLAKNKEVSGLAPPNRLVQSTFQHNPIVQKQLIDALSNFE